MSNPPSSPNQNSSRDAAAELRVAVGSPDNRSTCSPPSPAEYIRRFGRVRSEEHWEVIRFLLTPLVLQRYPMVEIASLMGISVETAARWKNRLLSDLRQEAVTMQPRDFIMESLESLREARSEAWKGYSLATEPREKRAFLKCVVQAEALFGKFGADIGLYGARGDKPLSPAAYGEGNDDGGSVEAQRIQSMIVEFLGGAPSENHQSEDGKGEDYDTLLAEIRATPEDASGQREPSRATIAVRKRSRPIH